MAEIDNESEGGVSPTTLESALDSVRQGYNPTGDMDMETVGRELEQLLDQLGPDTAAEPLLTVEDWTNRPYYV